MGAHLELSSHVQAVCAAAGPTDFNITVSIDGAQVVLLREYREALLGAPLEDEEKVARANPITYVSGDEPPFLIAHGDVDDQVDIENSRRLYRALSEAGAEVTFRVVEGRGHEFFGDEVDELVGRFFQKHLAPSTA